MDGSAIVKRIDELVSAKHMAKADFLKSVGVSSSAYSQWNTGKTSPRLDSLSNIADFLGIELWELFTDAKKSDGMSYTEHILVNCWRRASDDDREILGVVLRKYGFDYTREEKEKEAVS